VSIAKIRESFWDVPLFRNASTRRNYSPRTLGDEAVLKTKAKKEQHHHQTATPRYAFSFNTRNLHPILISQCHGGAVKGRTCTIREEATVYVYDC
jgi:hypothetical protein